MQVAVEALLVRERVDLCFTGHDHGYERSHPVNVIIIINNIIIITQTIAKKRVQTSGFVLRWALPRLRTLTSR